MERVFFNSGLVINKFLYWFFLDILIVKIQDLPDLRIKEKADFEPAFSLSVFRVCYYLLQNGNVIHNVQMKLCPELPYDQGGQLT